ncbi:hypothetical protein FHX81_0950 [Saccharothrix saharensis]|uniref:Uncharacterized protein n=1 Tax=Saccharothrix saharensis TaxID=571190 RepID=A0A543J765_9PSEU|nr:hypothetical protein [Saccharothrix saharensis]TQM78674.1 hypothetical protein FHX81_0950 [Saccharothrix saharensis]
MSGLERRYRRLLSWYPRDHRERHGEEMLVVLMSGARDRSRPTPRESLDLVWGAVRLHLRRVVAADGGVDPRDVLAIVALLGPVALLTGATNGVHEIGWWVRADALAQMPWLEQFPDAPVWVLWGVVAVLVLRGLRRTAASFAWSAVAVCVLLAAFVPFQRWWIGMDSGWLLTGLLTAVALTWSPGPARGRALVGGRGIVVMAVTVVVAGVVGVLGHNQPVAELLRLALLVGGTLAACGSGSRIGRRAALILLLPSVTALLGLAQWSVLGRIPVAAEVAVFYGLPVVVLLALGGLPRRIRRAGSRHR